MKFTATILTINKPDRNGRLYDDQAIEAMLHRAEVNPIFGELGVSSQPTIDLSRVSHAVRALEQVDGTLQAEVEVLSTPSGEILKRLIEAGIRLQFSPNGVGTISDGVVSNYRLESIDVEVRNED